MEENETGDWELLQTEEMTAMVNASGSGIGVQTDCLTPRSSNNEDWIYPTGEVSFESSNDRFDYDKFVDLDATSELNFDGNDKGRKDFDEIGALVVKSEDSVDELSNSEMKSEESELPQVTEIGGNEEELEDTIMQMDNREYTAVEAVKPTPEEDKRSILWWKTPFNFFKCCAFRFKPIWTLSVVAAAMGFVILGRRWHRLKNKSQGLKLKVTTDENKATRLMNHVDRMNEAISVVRRVPVIRPSLPAAGVTVTWSRIGLR
ncbi:ATG8-interacting protein 2-like [Impatiens glandulifera]|uniref:ATG8-interacting protein 2-like n=1 Tax=Impatiens glandulifera TaxID=253017 RepID=UPI001FB061E5|nr:ATG8-interacting protein 2-like [Impatiens glandulifera]